MKDLYDRINKKIEILYGKRFTGFDVDFARARNGRPNYNSFTICPKLNGVGCWFWGGIGIGFDGDFEAYAKNLDNALTKQLEELNSSIEKALEKSEDF